jgi:alkylhydroperoxidase family enzyme
VGRGGDEYSGWARPDAVYQAVREQFTDVETVNLTLLITTINAWNAISIALGCILRMGAGEG